MRRQAHAGAQTRAEAEIRQALVKPRQVPVVCLEIVAVSQEYFRKARTGRGDAQTRVLVTGYKRVVMPPVGLRLGIPSHPLHRDWGCGVGEDLEGRAAHLQSLTNPIQ